MTFIFVIIVIAAITVIVIIVIMFITKAIPLIFKSTLVIILLLNYTRIKI